MLATDGPRQRSSIVTRLGLFPLVVSLGVFVTAFLLDNYELVAVQPNGLPKYTIPYAQYSFYLLIIATALLVFSVSFSLVSVKSKGIVITHLRGVVAGSAVFAIGTTISGFYWLFLWVDQGDYASRCGIGYCAPQLISSYRLDTELWSVAIVAGLVLTGFGLWLIIRSWSRGKNLMGVSSGESPALPDSDSNL